MKQKLIRLFLTFVLFLGAVMVSINGNSVQAVTKVAKAKSIYKKVLQKGEASYKDKDGIHSVTIESFYLLDIDQKGVPELIVKNTLANDFGTRYIYTVKNGKLVYCGNYFEKGEAGLRYSAKYKSICYGWWTNGIGGIGNVLYKLKNYQIKEYKYIYESMESQTSNKMEYWYGNKQKNAKKVSRKKHNSMYKKYFHKIKTYAFYDNTPVNISKMLD